MPPWLPWAPRVPVAQPRPASLGRTQPVTTVTVKRPQDVQGTALFGSASSTGPSSGGDPVALAVTSHSKKNEIGINTLIGDYAEKGANHGRKYYQKIQVIPGHEDIKVYLYYWDTRDGQDFCGWWFGDQIGGSQVWARCNSHTPQPPRVGWKIPWDAPKSEPGILFVDMTSPSQVIMPGSPSGALGGSQIKKEGLGELQQKVSKIAEQINTSSLLAEEAIRNSKIKSAVNASEEVLKQVQDALQTQQQALNEVQRNLTQEIADARKLGLPATSLVTEFSRQSSKMRTVQASLTTETNRVKGILFKSQKDAQANKRLVELQEQSKKQEEADAKAFEQSIPEAQDMLTSAEDSVESVVIMASPLVAEPPEEAGETLDKALVEIEMAALDAQNRITETRQHIGNKLMAARKYAPETRKRALNDFSTMQQKLTEYQKKLNPYKTFKKEFHLRVEARKALMEITEKLGTAELEVEKASMISTGSDQGQMSEEDVTTTQELVGPAQQAVVAVIKLIEQKMRVAHGPVRDELLKLQERSLQSKDKIGKVVAVLASQRELLTAHKMVALAAEKVDKAEESLLKCQEAEMPFLKGIEVLPPEESVQAITVSEAAAASSETAISVARIFIKTKCTEAKRYSKEASKIFLEELRKQEAKLDSTASKLSTFRHDTVERKMASLLADVVEGVSLAERRVKLLTDAVAPLSTDDFEKMSIEELKQSNEKVGAVEKEAATACQQARQLVGVKQKQTKAGESALALQKLNARLTTVQQEMTKHRNTISACQKLIQGKEVLTEEETKIEHLQRDVEKVEAMASSKELSDETFREMDQLVSNCLKALKASMRAVESQIPGSAWDMKAALQKLAEKCKKAQAQIEVVQSNTKKQRERVMTESYVAEGTKKTEAVEEAMEKVNDAELPFLKGIEVLPLAEATNTIEASEAAAHAVQEAVGVARTYIASKNIEIRKFEDAVSKPAATQFAELTKRINAATQKLGVFRKETDTRKKIAQMQEAGERVKSIEELVKQTKEAAEPLTKLDAENMSEEDFQLCQKFQDLAKDAQAKLDSARVFIIARQKEAQGNATQEEILKKLSTRLVDAAGALSKSKQIGKNHEHKLTARKILIDATEMVKVMEEDTAKAQEACSPLIEKGGEQFLVAARALKLSQVLRSYMQKNQKNEEQMFKEACGEGASVITQEVFLKFLEGLPEKTSNEEVIFTAERQLSIFNYLDTENKGELNLERFQKMFRREMVCLATITMTDAYDVGESKTVGKLDPQDKVETLGAMQKDNETGMTRIECRVLPDGKRGWVTLQGNQGTAFLEEISSISTFMAETNKQVEECQRKTAKASVYFKAKLAELTSSGATGPMAATAAAMRNMRSKVAIAQSSLDLLKKKLIKGKQDYLARERVEANAHIAAREKKEAAAITAVAHQKVDAVEALVKQLEQCASPLTLLKGAALGAFATPATVADESAKLLTAVTCAFEEAKTCIKEQQSKIKSSTAAMQEAKKEMQKLSLKNDAAEKASKKVGEDLHNACTHLISDKYEKASAAMRKHAREKGLSYDDLFKELLPEGEDRIPHATFSKYLETLDGCTCLTEQASLLCKHIETGGIGRRSFMRILQTYFAVVKGIAITNCFEISATKTLRKAEIDEVIEILDGPCSDEKVGVTRIKGRSLNDGVEGWITVRGNQGTPFLCEVEKPMYACSTEVAFEKDFKGGELLRTLKVDEVVELIEGPRKEVYPNALRFRGRASLDGATGWLTLKDKYGTNIVEANDKYHICTASVAMTDVLPVKDCKVVKKMSVDELFIVLEGPVKEEETGIMRVKGRSVADNKEGWITIEGNAGSRYAEASTKHYTVLQDTTLTKTFPSEKSTVIRQLAKDEAILLLEGPKEESFQPEVRIKGRALSDGAVGWITMTGQNVRPWSPYYTCCKEVPMRSSQSIEGAEVVRQIEVDEMLELLEGPLRVADDQALQMKGRAQNDGKVGWVTIKESTGVGYFQ